MTFKNGKLKMTTDFLSETTQARTIVLKKKIVLPKIILQNTGEIRTFFRQKLKIFVVTRSVQ